MSKKDTPIIKCPICGYEYLPAEIFFADEFLGEPGEIIRPMGKEIDCYLGDGMKLAEDFVCDSCGTPLHIAASVAFTVTANPDLNMDIDSTTKIVRAPKQKLKEVSLFD